MVIAALLANDKEYNVFPWLSEIEPDIWDLDDI